MGASFGGLLARALTPPLSTAPAGSRVRTPPGPGAGEVAPSAPRAGCAETLPVGVFRRSELTRAVPAQILGCRWQNHGRSDHIRTRTLAHLPPWGPYEGHRPHSARS